MTTKNDYAQANYMINVRGLAPQSGDPLNPDHWILPDDILQDNIRNISSEELIENGVPYAQDLYRQNHMLEYLWYERAGVQNDVIADNLELLEKFLNETREVHNNEVDEEYLNIRDLQQTRRFEKSFWTAHFEGRDTRKRSIDTYQRFVKESATDLSFEEFKFLRAYQNVSVDINRYAYIRNERLFPEDKNVSELSRCIQTVDSIFEKHGIVNKAPVELYRGLESHLLEPIVEAAETRSTYLNKPYMSTSYNVRVARTFSPDIVKVVIPPNMFKILMTESVKGAYQGEQEVLLPRNIEFKVTEEAESDIVSWKKGKATPAFAGYILTAVGIENFGLEEESLQKQLSNISEQMAARARGLVPQSGDWAKPFRWIKGRFSGNEEDESERFQDFKSIVEESFDYEREIDILNDVIDNGDLSIHKRNAIVEAVGMLRTLEKALNRPALSSNLESFEFKFDEDGKLKSLGRFRSDDALRELHFYGAFLLPSTEMESSETGIESDYGTPLIVDAMRRFISEEVDMNSLVVPSSLVAPYMDVMKQLGFELKFDNYYQDNVWSINKDDALESYNKVAEKFDVKEIVPQEKGSYVQNLIQNNDVMNDELARLEEDFFDISTKKESIDDNLAEISELLDYFDESGVSDEHVDEVEKLKREFRKNTISKYNIEESIYTNELKNDFITLASSYEDFSDVDENAKNIMHQILSDEDFVYDKDDENIQHIKKTISEYVRFTNEVSRLNKESLRAAKTDYNFANDVLYFRELSKDFNKQYSLDSVNYLMNLWAAQDDYSDPDPKVPDNPSLDYWRNLWLSKNQEATHNHEQAIYMANKYVNSEHELFDWLEANSIAHYSLDSFYINKYLYQQEDDVQDDDSLLSQTIRRMETAFEKLPLNPEEMVLYRGVKKANFANIIDAVKNYLFGSSYTNKTFTSTSQQYDVAKNFAAGNQATSKAVSDQVLKDSGGQVFRIIAPPNTVRAMNVNDVSLSLYKSEKEVLLPRNLSMKIVAGPGDDPNFDGYTIEISGVESLNKQLTPHEAYARGLEPMPGRTWEHPGHWVTSEQGQPYTVDDIANNLQIIEESDAVQLDYLETRDLIDANINLALNYFDLMHDTFGEEEYDSSDPFFDDTAYISETINHNLDILFDGGSDLYYEKTNEYNNSIDEDYLDGEDLDNSREYEKEFGTHYFLEDDPNDTQPPSISFDYEDDNELMRQRRFYKKEYEKKMEATGIDISFDNFLAVNEYQRGSYTLNRYAYIRNERLFPEDKNTSVLSKIIRNLDSVFDNSNVNNEQLMLFRGLQKEVYRDIEKVFEDGMVYLNKSFVSTSLNYESAYRFANVGVVGTGVVRIIIPPGMLPTIDVWRLGSPGEGEVLLPRNVEFTVSKDVDGYMLTATGHKKFGPEEELQKSFNVEVSSDNIAGLSNRDSLSVNSGMLFLLPENIRPVFTMQGMKFPLDFICIDEYNNIVHLERNVEPRDDIVLIFPDSTKSVLEINAGETGDLSVGESISYLQKQLTPQDAQARGWEPQSGDWNRPVRWVRPQDDDGDREEQLDAREFVGRIRNSYNFDEEMKYISTMREKVDDPDDAISLEYIGHRLEALDGLLNKEKYDQFDLEDLESYEFKFDENRQLKAFAMVSDNYLDSDEFEVQSVVTMPSIFKQPSKNKVGYGVQLMIDIMRRFITESESSIAMSQPLVDKLEKHYKRLFGFEYKEEFGNYFVVDRHDALAHYNKYARFFGVSPINENEVSIQKQLNMAEQIAARNKGLVPQSGDWNSPIRWVKPQPQEQEVEPVNEKAQILEKRFARYNIFQHEDVENVIKNLEIVNDEFPYLNLTAHELLSVNWYQFESYMINQYAYIRGEYISSNDGNDTDINKFAKHLDSAINKYGITNKKEEMILYRGLSDDLIDTLKDVYKNGGEEATYVNKPFMSTTPNHTVALGFGVVVKIVIPPNLIPSLDVAETYNVQVNSGDFIEEEEILLPRNITFKVSYNNDREEYTLTAMGRAFNR